MTLAAEYVRQLELMRNRLRRYSEGHAGRQLCIAYRMADLIRMGQFDAIKRIAGWQEAK